MWLKQTDLNAVSMRCLKSRPELCEGYITTQEEGSVKRSCSSHHVDFLDTIQWISHDETLSNQLAVEEAVLGPLSPTGLLLRIQQGVRAHSSQDSRQVRTKCV